MLRVLIIALRLRRLRRENPQIFDAARALEAIHACILEDSKLEFAGDRR